MSKLKAGRPNLHIGQRVIYKSEIVQIAEIEESGVLISGYSRVAPHNTYYPNYWIPFGEITFIEEEDSEQSTVSLIAENVSLLKQIDNMKQRIARKEEFFISNTKELQKRLEPEMVKHKINIDDFRGLL